MATRKLNLLAVSLVPLLVLFLTVSPNAVAGQPDINPDNYTCSRNISSLQELQPIGNSDEDFTMCISISADTHTINYTSTPIAYSVVMMGNNATIRCRPEVPLSNSDYNTFIFQSSRMVRLENVHFRDCLRPVLIREVLSVQLVNATFSNFHPAGALEILNSPTVIAKGCRFTNNTSFGIGMTSYSGNAGGIAIGFNNTNLPILDDTERIAISIYQSVFVKNSASVIPEFNRSTGEVLATRIYNQRGGGVALYFGTAGLSADVSIDGCDFEENVADSAGGGVYMYLTGEGNAHAVNITDTNFMLNTAVDGGGLEISFDTAISVREPNDIHIANCKFLRNKGNFGGGFKSIQLNSHGNQNKVKLVNCEFTENDAPVGSGIYFQSRFTIITVAMETRIVLRDCNFTNNIANRGVLFLTRNTVELQGRNLFIGNTGPSIRVVNSLLSIRDGDVWFRSNRRHDEGFSGQLYLSSFGQLLLHRNSNLTFINNTGSEGACIVANGQSITNEFIHQLYNPQCFMVYEDPTIPPPQWEVTMTFIENGAVVGPVIFLSDFESCDWNSTESPYFAENSPNTTWTFMDIRDNYVIRNGAEGQEKRYEPEYGIQTEIHSLQLSNKTIRASPGDPIVLTAVALDQLGHNTSAFLEITSETNSPLFQPGIVQTQAGVGEIDFTYFSATLDTSGNATVQLRASFTPLQIPTSEVTLLYEDCLPGYSFSANESQCLCDETEEIVLCETNRQGILLANGLWGAPPNWSRTLVTLPCPAGYCNCTGGQTAAEGTVGCLLVYDNPFSICDKTRKGILCGKCREGYGLGLLTTKCRSYSGSVPEYYWLVPIYVVLVIPAMIVIVKLGVKFPTVLKGFLLYIQLAPIAVDFLPRFFDLRQDVMDCISSILAFYFPYDFNFHEGLTALRAYGLRYIAVLFAVTVVPIAMKIRYRSKNWHGVWTIILLMYVMTTETSISLLFCPTLHRTVNGERIVTTIWFFDGNVECYQDVHLLLTIISVFVLIFLGMLIPIVALIIYYDKIAYKFPIFDRLERCSKAITRGLKPEFQWWPIQELITRYIFVIAVVLSPGLRTLPLALSLVIVTLHTFVHPYMDWKANYTESLVMVTLVIILALGNTSPLVEVTRNVKKFTLWPLLYLPVIVGAGYVLVLFTYYLWKWLSSLKKRKEESTDNNIVRSFTASFSALHRAWRVRTVTTTTVSLTDHGTDSDDDDGDDEDDGYDSGSRQSRTFTDSVPSSL